MEYGVNKDGNHEVNFFLGFILKISYGWGVEMKHCIITDGGTIIDLDSPFLEEHRYETIEDYMFDMYRWDAELVKVFESTNDFKLTMTDLTE